MTPSATLPKLGEWWKEPKVNEYSYAEVVDITGFGEIKIRSLAKEGKIKRTRHGFYDKASVDAYQKDREERLAVTPNKTIKKGGGYA